MSILAGKEAYYIQKSCVARC